MRRDCQRVGDQLTDSHGEAPADGSAPARLAPVHRFRVTLKVAAIRSWRHHGAADAAVCSGDCVLPRPQRSDPGGSRATGACCYQGSTAGPGSSDPGPRGSRPPVRARNRAGVLRPLALRSAGRLAVESGRPIGPVHPSGGARRGRPRSVGRRPPLVPARPGRRPGGQCRRARQLSGPPARSTSKP